MMKGFNEWPGEIRAIARLVRDKLGPVEVDLLPYNRMGESKYEFLGRNSFQAESGTDEDLEPLHAEVRQEMGRRTTSLHG